MRKLLFLLLLLMFVAGVKYAYCQDLSIIGSFSDGGKFFISSFAKNRVYKSAPNSAI